MVLQIGFATERKLKELGERVGVLSHKRTIGENHEHMAERKSLCIFYSGIKFHRRSGTFTPKTGHVCAVP